MASGEHRQSSRVRVPVDAIVRSKDSYFYAETRDMSATGLSLNTRNAFAVGSRVSLVLGQPPRLPKITAEGIIRWLSKGEGVGIEFSGLNPEDRAVLSTFLESIGPQTGSPQ